MTQPLSLEDQVIVALRRISRAIDLHSRVLVQQYGLTTPQLAALRAVGQLQPVSVGRVAKSIHLSLATVTGILTRLEGRKLVVRSRDGQDRRTVVVTLTHEGSRVLGSVPSLLQDRFRNELARLQPWEQTQLLASLQRIASMMDADGLDAAPLLGPTLVNATPEQVSVYLDDIPPSESETPSVEPSGEPTDQYPAAS